MTTTLTSCAAWQALQRHYEKIGAARIDNWFAADPQRASRYSGELESLFIDWSKHRIDDSGIALLMQLARERNVEQARERMFCGAAINTTEQRAVLHTALRNRGGSAVTVDGNNVMPDVDAVLRQLQRFCDDVREQRWRGYNGRPITDVVNIGIGGSHLGPQMVTEALRAYAHPSIRSHFVANIDGADITGTLQQLDPASTLFIVASKSFTTQETMTNAHTARKWFLDAAANESAIASHFVAVSTNADAVTQFGIDPNNMFGFWDWVGGRYSLWSAIGLPIMISIGFERFEQLLEGAHLMDCHFRAAPLEQNLPVILAMLGIWYVNFFDAGAHAVLPYAERLCWLPDYLQQADMESNGKRTTHDGAKVDYATGPVIWGSPGTNGQHAYFQLLHQGTHLIPADFIVVATGEDGPQQHHTLLLANCLAQSEALMSGRSLASTSAQLQADGLAAERVDELAPHRTFPGNRPSTTIVLDKLTPQALGSLIALYEHKIFVQGVVWGINSFDQWGVELGKQLAAGVAPELEAGAASGRNASTAQLIEKIRKRRRYDE